MDVYRRFGGTLLHYVAEDNILHSHLPEKLEAETGYVFRNACNCMPRLHCLTNMQDRLPYQQGIVNEFQGTSILEASGLELISLRKGSGSESLIFIW